MEGEEGRGGERKKRKHGNKTLGERQEGEERWDVWRMRDRRIDDEEEREERIDGKIEELRE